MDHKPTQSIFSLQIDHDQFWDVPHTNRAVVSLVSQFPLYLSNPSVLIAVIPIETPGASSDYALHIETRCRRPADFCWSTLTMLDRLDDLVPQTASQRLQTLIWTLTFCSCFNILVDDWLWCCRLRPDMFVLWMYIPVCCVLMMIMHVDDCKNGVGWLLCCHDFSCDDAKIFRKWKLKMW